MTRLPLILLLALTCGIGFPQEVDIKVCEREVFLGNETITPAADCVADFVTSGRQVLGVPFHRHDRQSTLVPLAS